MISIVQVQTRLKELGYDPGPIDGVRGRLTITAVKAFQAATGLTPDGLIGHLTAERLFTEVLASDQLPDATPWMDVAARVNGLHEELNNSELYAFLRSDGGSVGDPSKNPWCADFVQTCIALSMPDEPLPTNPYLSLNWLKFGQPVELCPGATLVFWRESRSSHLGHVAFCLDVYQDSVLVRGGNQSDSVCDIEVPLDRLREGGVRWPSTALPAAPLRRTRGTTLSKGQNPVSLDDVLD